MASSATRNYLVTGGGRGIGRGLGRLLLQKGHRVLLIDHNEEELSNTASLLAKTYNAGKQFDVQVCNLRNPPDIKSAADRAGKLFGGHLDCLVKAQTLLRLFSMFSRCPSTWQKLDAAMFSVSAGLDWGVPLEMRRAISPAKRICSLDWFFIPLQKSL